MSRHSIFVAIALFAFFGAFSAQAQVDVDCTANTFLTVQQAVNAAPSGDVVIVHPNCSNGPNPINIINRNNLQIVSADQQQSFFGAYPVGPNQWPPSNSYVYDQGQSCIHIEDSSDISIVGLQFEYCVDDGITILNSKRITVQGVATYFVGADGIAVRGSHDVNLSGNFLFGAYQWVGQWGISVDSNSDLVRIQNNRITKNANGILMKGNRVHVLNNDISDNNGFGIFVASARSTVSRNTVLNNAGTQIDFSSQPPDTCLIGNQTNGGIVPLAGCVGSNQ